MTDMPAKVAHTPHLFGWAKSTLFANTQRTAHIAQAADILSPTSGRLNNKWRTRWMPVPRFNCSKIFFTALDWDVVALNDARTNE